MPVTTSTSGLLRVETSSYYLRATKTDKRLNNCMLLHAQHQEITDDLDLVHVARNFVDANDEDKNSLDQPITVNVQIFVVTIFRGLNFRGD